MNNETSESYENITKLYKNLTYFDQYSNSVILFIIINILFFLGLSYCYVMINAQPIINDWPNKRCSPMVMPFAGILNRPEGVTIADYTEQNFNYCTQSILSNISSIAIQPLTYVTSALTDLTSTVSDAIQDIRGMFNKIRTLFQSISEEIMGRLMNFMIPLQQIIISVRDLISKMQGSMTAGLYTFLGAYYALQSFIGLIAQSIVIALIALAAMIAIFWILPFTWGAAATATALFVSICIPMALLLAFMVDVLKVQTNLSLPKVKCFDKNTKIVMNDGTTKKIKNIKTGDVLYNNNTITAIIKVETKGSVMYKLNNIIVSDSHLIKYANKWVRVSEHPEATKIVNYNQPYLYCLNTKNKIIQINKYIFADWDDLTKKIINKWKKNNIIKKTSDIHLHFDEGLGGSTKIELNNNIKKSIKNITIGDTLKNGEKIYGTVIINGKDMKQYKYILGKNNKITGSSNIINNKKYLKKYDLKNKNKNKKLYHLLTDTSFFYIKDHLVINDYNSSIDFLLSKFV